jgi:cysteine desulfurase/selenocysteine lyase
MNVRKDFPVLNETRNGKPIIYLDSTCVALKPKPVIEAILAYYENYTACGGRSFHKFGIETTEIYENTRSLVAEFIGAPTPNSCSFVRNTTEGMNIISQGLKWKKNNVVISEDVAHNSNLVPWMQLASQGKIIHKMIEVGLDGKIFVEQLEELMTRDVKLVSFGHTSNVTGYTIPAKEIIKLAHDYNALVLLDAAQSVPHLPVNVKDLDVDFLAFSLHKMCGPSGMGILYIKPGLESDVNLLITGGDTVVDVTENGPKFAQAPARYEAGLQNYAGIAGTGAAIKYLSQIGMEKIRAYELELIRKLVKGLVDLNLPGFKLVGPPYPEKRAGLASFAVSDVDPDMVAMLLDENANVFVRVGYHCCHLWHHRLQLPATLRPSLYIYNTFDEVRIFLDTLSDIFAQFT